MPSARVSSLSRRSTFCIAVGLAFCFAGLARALGAVDFSSQVQPILEVHCVGCHRAENAQGELRLDDQASAFKGGRRGASIVPGNSAASFLYAFLSLPPGNPLQMPPAANGDPLAPAEMQILKDWIDGGAAWPEMAKLVARKKIIGAGADTPELAARIRARIVSAAKPIAPDTMQRYSTTIPGSEVAFEMVAIPGGKFRMGSPATEPGRQPDEGPRADVSIAPFWLGKCEVTWDEFELFMFPEEERKTRATKEIAAEVNALTDAISHPTKPYTDMSFGMGRRGFPATGMTQHAANKYCQWLSAKTGQFYRLPTEAEWEYAARAGTQTAYFWGDDPTQIGDYCVWGNNSDFRYGKVGTKKPNPWGLYDILGNVMEWTLDQYAPEYYSTMAADNPWNRAAQPYPHAVRGGSFDDDEPAKLRCAARRFSVHDWKVQDPQLPQSIWYHTEARWVGFRVLRPLAVPEAAEMSRYWNSGVEYDIPGFRPAE